MSFPFVHGFAPDRWKRVTDIMLEKEQGNSRCHRLRILALFEKDFNQAKRIVIGRRLMHHLEDFDMLSPMQDGSRPGRQCISAVLKKTLAHDYVRLTATTAAFIENDAIGCYDRLVNNLILMLLKKLGLPPTVSRCMGELWDKVVHLIKPCTEYRTLRMDPHQNVHYMAQAKVQPADHYFGYYVIGL